MEEDFTEAKLRAKYGYSPKRPKTIGQKLRKKAQCSSSCLKKKLFGFVPILRWLPRYQLKKCIVGDIVSGLTTSVVRIPQGLAYGLLAGVDPINGLYTGFFSPLIYTIFGTSRHISVGVFSIISLMLGSAVDKFNSNRDVSSSVISTTVPTEGYTTAFANVTSGSDVDPTVAEPENLAVVSSITVLVGLILVLLGTFRLGIVAMFLSDPLVSSFTTGAAIYVVTAQMKYVTGIKLQRQSGAFALIKTYADLLSRLGEIQWPSVILSIACLVILVPLKYVNRTYKKKLHNMPIPVELFIVVVGTVVSGAVDLNGKYNTTIVGKVPSGMPSPILPNLSIWPLVVSDAISIAIVIFAVAVSMGKIFAKKHGYRIDPNQELFALGFCQLTTGFCRGHAGGGALARSTVQESSGGNTQVAALFSCSVLLLVLLVIGPLFENLPVACLACIILANLHGLLMQFEVLPRLWKLDVYDFSVWVLTFVFVILLGVDMGLLAGVVYSLCCSGIRSSRTKLNFLGEIEGTGNFRDVAFYGDALQIPGIKIVQFSQSPTYANKSLLQNITPDLIGSKASKNPNKLEEPKEEDDLNDNVEVELTSTVVNDHPSTQIVIFDCSCWNVIDTVGMSTLKSVFSDLAAADIRVFLASVQHDVYQKLELSEILSADDDSSSIRVYPSVSYAFGIAKTILPSVSNKKTDLTGV